MRIKSLGWNKFWSDIKKKIPVVAVVWFFVYYAIALVILVCSIFFNDYSINRFFSNFLSWSMTLLIPNIFLSTAYLLSKKSDLIFSHLYLAGSWFFAFFLFAIYLLHNLASKFQDFIGSSTLILLILLAIINFHICYSLAKPIFEKDVMRETIDETIKEADETKSGTSAMKDKLEREGLQ